MLKTDHIDIFQFHNPASCPKPGDESGLYDAMLQAKQQGRIRFIGITNHRLDVAREAIESGLYDTLQFPFSYLSTKKELELVQACKDKGMGFIAIAGAVATACRVRRGFPLACAPGRRCCFGGHPRR
jgi:aryl-alcohol dehydrogenase-like predicted oxidoreductase